jgi:hypothetical protein
MRSLFDLPLRLRRTYMAVVSLLNDTAAHHHRWSRQSTIGVTDTVLDSDIAFTTGQGLASTRRDPLDLGADLLIIEETDQGIRVAATVAQARNGSPLRLG